MPEWSVDPASGEGVDPQKLRNGILSVLNPDSETSCPGRSDRIARFGVAFVESGVTSDDQAISIIRLVGDKWSGFILAILGCGMFRYTDLQRVINFMCDAVGARKISQRVLTQKLRSFERDGLVSRTVRPSVPVRTEYRLTPMGKELAQIIGHLSHWSFANREAVANAQRRYDESEVRL